MQRSYIKQFQIYLCFRIPLCALINQHLRELAIKFKATKFLKSISTTCVPNYPDKNLPTIFVYFEGEMKAQLIGPASFRRADIFIEGKNMFCIKFCCKKILLALLIFSYKYHLHFSNLV